uniref:Uncharacterized protein n=1 Tax=Amphimedon queenslandica TaxID=400682 RepID=A0A1X7UVS0_AMPQE
MSVSISASASKRAKMLSSRSLSTATFSARAALSCSRSMGVAPRAVSNSVTFLVTVPLCPDLTLFL